ncbi:DUF3192 domain-containing protein [Halosquirtibacter laminarini]|uniref:DUF3192 domain-containing protein n=1 Tax=Halosquirtibacter laminarini TaxID=3374600 RepID=A0AC61NEN2_9BACT|nr:DUF3192 domain-containing protein [Prolixibacteraceae bacterium]
MRNIHLLTSFIILIIASSCSTTGKLRTKNKMNLIKVEAGMSQDEVLALTKGITKTTTEFGQLYNNPYYKTINTLKNGSVVTTLWFYTDKISADGKINMNELTPVVLEDNSVIGIGWKSYLDYCDVKDITPEDYRGEPNTEKKK